MQSFIGMSLGWAVMLCLLFGGFALMAVLDGGPGWFESGTLWFVVLFALCSAAVCLVAWLLVAWPVTWWCRRALGSDSGWWWHGLRGAAFAFAVGLLPGLFGGGINFLVWWFAGLASVVGLVAGGVTGWRARRSRILCEELQPGVGA